jgi:hypothetical protein
MMHRPKDQMTTIAVLGIITVVALLLVAKGTPASEVREILGIMLPPLVAVAASAKRMR